MSGRLVRIRGKVQGVWYRAWTVQEATRRGLRGWVRNRRDGSVEAFFAGEAARHRGDDRRLPHRPALGQGRQHRQRGDGGGAILY